MMRIITGKARGIRLATLEGETTRPTAERVKEAVFSFLQFDIEGREVLDLFAGSGQLALEALSRGAAHAVMTDRSREAVAIIRANAKKTGLEGACEIYNCEYTDYIRKNRGKRFDIIFLDPPYAQNLCTKVVEALDEADMIKPSTVIVCESERDDVLVDGTPFADRFEAVKKTAYGRAFITVLTPKRAEG